MKEREFFYDTIAEELDGLMSRYDLERRVSLLFDELLAGVDLGGKRLLDAGCGTGPFSLAARRRGAQVVSLDLGFRLLRVAQGKGIHRGAAADVAAMPFPDGSFDVVLSSECIEHTPSPRASVAEMVRVLKPGGLLVLSCPNRFWYWSCRLANAFGLRPYRGLENWPGWWALRRWLRDSGVVVQRHVGLHLFPFHLAVSQPLLQRLDRLGGVVGPLYVNQCVRGMKAPAETS